MKTLTHRFSSRPLAISILLGLSACATHAATHFRLLSSFGSDPDGGRTPKAALIVGSDGAFYGTTTAGGNENLGTVFKLNKDGSGHTVLHSFAVGDDGGNPTAALLEGSDGLLYGTCAGSAPGQPGTVFRLNKDGSGYAILHSFQGDDGANPQAALIEASDGLLYGTTTQGGTNLDSYGKGMGTVFKLNKDGTSYAVLHHFGATNDGAHPVAALLQASDGMLYGTTRIGGTNGGCWGKNGGTVFKLKSDGSAYCVLHSFNDDCWARNPVAALIEGSDGAIYGTTGGNSTEHTQPQGTNGAVFKIEKDGTGFAVLRQLVGDNSGVAALAEGPDGALYGTVAGALHTHYGAYDRGMAFKVGKDGSNYNVLHTFDDGQHGPSSALVKGSDGAFSGVTDDGGAWNFGTVFKLWPPETPDMVGLSSEGGLIQVSFQGAAASHYQLLRSMDLSNWLVLTNLTMPASGIFTNVDNNPPSASAFYRAVWIP